MDRDTDPVQSAPPVAAGLTAGNLAYVIYTSGSTGQPKGVLVPHRGVVNAVEAFREEYGIQHSSRVLLFAPLHFDASVLDVFTALFAGATLVVGSRDELLPGGPLFHLLRMHEVTHAKFTPSALAAMPAADEVRQAGGLPALAAVVSGGEACPAAVVERWAPQRRFYNGYGPTETSVRVTVAEVADASDPPPLGRPVTNVQLYVLDRAGEPAPVGVAGELHIGGVQVARGYLNRPSLTADRFVPNPFGSASGGRLYRTGDLVRWRSDGMLEFVGRADFQVKVRGFRVELGEIEARLAEHAGVREAVVLAREDRPGDLRLVAYYLATSCADGAVVEAESLRAHLVSRLPDYMVPSAFARLEAWPLSPTGKLDRRALPTPGADAYATRGYEAPVGAVERALAEVWAAVLGVERVGRRDHFFELGGHSLLAVTLIERMQRRGLHVDVGTLFSNPTLATLAANVSEHTKVVDVPANRIPNLTPPARRSDVERIEVIL